MKLKTIYDSQDDIPEGYGDLYTERNGKWELTGIEGVKTQADVERVQEALRKEKADHKTARDKLTAFEGIDPTKVAETETALEEARAQLEAINKDGRIDEAKLEPIIAARVKQATAPLERDKKNLETALEAQKKVVADKDGEVVTLKSSITMDKIERQIRDAAAEAKLVPTAIVDAVLHGTRVFEQTEDGRTITKDVAGTTPGLTPKEWLKDMESKSPHWWPVSVGSGARGGLGGGPNSRANNPWSKEAWNITKQGAVVREHGEDKAKLMAESVGSHVGATKPPV